MTGAESRRKTGWRWRKTRVYWMTSSSCSAGCSERTPSWDGPVGKDTEAHRTCSKQDCCFNMMIHNCLSLIPTWWGSGTGWPLTMAPGAPWDIGETQWEERESCWLCPPCCGCSMELALLCCCCCCCRCC